jgi:hypothetical protein
MYRRRRRTRDIPFGLDSFLDLIANVVGVIIRLILVAWVGAKSYDMIRHLAPRESAAEKPPAIESENPLAAQLAEARRELDETRRRAMDLLPRLEEHTAQRAQLEAQLAELAVHQQALETRQKGLALEQGETVRSRQALERVLADLSKRRRTLEADVALLAKLPPVKKELRYRTPVSRPVFSDELHFECRDGRVAFVDVAAFLNDIRRGLEEKEKLLRSQWKVEDVTAPVGPFRLRYTMERERGTLDVLGNGLQPDAAGMFRYGVTRWVVEPLAPVRGETAEAALQPRSEFRQIIDTIDARTTVVTLWVYPNSFALFRRLRDYLHERQIEVAGRPLPDHIPIASSRSGTASRGQ